MKIFVLEITSNQNTINMTSYALEFGIIYFGPYTSPQGHVIVAENELRAREIAAGKDEPWWLLNWLTSCKEIETNEEAIILSDTPTG